MIPADARLAQRLTERREGFGGLERLLALFNRDRDIDAFITRESLRERVFKCGDERAEKDEPT